MNIVLLGGPGAGKGTLAEGLVANYKMSHYSTGDLLREALANKTDLGMQAKEYMDKGALVPDSLIVDIMKDKISSSQGNDVIFDGFPRTTAQAQSLDEMLKQLGQSVDLALLLNCPDSIVIDRICSRRMCKNCGAIGSVRGLSPQEAAEYKCKECGSETYQRDDDNQDTVLNRINVYNTQTAPVVDYYKNQGVVKEIDASKNPQCTLDQVKELLK